MFDQLRQRLLDLPDSATSFAGRGFRGGSEGGRERIEGIGRTFLTGYRAALADSDPWRLQDRLAGVPLADRGFAYEGAAMALAVRDLLTPWHGGRLAAFLAGPADAHAYLVYVGVGWLMARTRCRLEWILPRPDPLLRWLAFDGWGFHHGYFHGEKYLGTRPAPGGLSGYARRVFDQGLGRSLWFVEGTEVARIIHTLTGFSPERRADLWSGIGLAATYAGEVAETDLEMLRDAAGEQRPALAQGSAFAAKARQRAGNLVPYTERAGRILCQTSADQAALITDTALENLPADSGLPAYEVWRERVRRRLSPAPVLTR